MHKKIAFIIVAIVVSGCQAYKSTTFDENPKRVGVISLMGSEVGLYHRGMTVFGNQVNSVEIEGVDLNDIFQEKIGEALQYDYEPVDFDFNQEEMFALLKKDKPASFSSFMFGENKFMYLEEEIKTISSENDLDAIVLMVPVKAAVQSADVPEGVSIYSAGPSGKVSKSWAGVFSALVLIDGGNGREVRRTTLRGEVGFTGNYFLASPLMDIREYELADVTVREVTEEDKRRMEEIFSAIPEQSMVNRNVKDLMKGPSLEW